MTFDLEKPFTAGTAVKEQDARAMKIALNHLGYYAPNPKLGITAIPDAGVFTALKAFQKDHDLQATASAKPHDQTVEMLNAETEKQDSSSGQYVWHTVQDDHVRSSHRQREGQVFSWGSPPEGGHPGEDYNCRCWAVPVKDAAEGLTQTVTSAASDSQNRWTDADFAEHFYTGGGQDKTLPEIGLLGDVIEHAKQIMFDNVLEQVSDNAKFVKNGSIAGAWSNSYPFGDVVFSFGGAIIKGHFKGTVKKNGKVLVVDAKAEYSFLDTFTDPLNKRQKKIGTSALENVPYDFSKSILYPKNMAAAYFAADTEYGGTPYDINGGWTTKISGDSRAARSVIDEIEKKKRHS